MKIQIVLWPTLCLSLGYVIGRLAGAWIQTHVFVDSTTLIVLWR